MLCGGWLVAVAGCSGGQEDPGAVQEGNADSAQEVSLKAKARLLIDFSNVSEKSVRVRALNTIPAVDVALRVFHGKECIEAKVSQDSAADAKTKARFPTLDVDVAKSKAFCLVVENTSKTQPISFRLEIGDAARAGTTEACQRKIDAEMAKEAIGDDDTASLVGQRLVYGDREGSFGDLLIVRASDEVDPTDFVVITSRLGDDGVDPVVCELEFASFINEGLLPDDLNDLEAVLPNEVCLEAIDEAVLAEAKKINETASIVGRAPVYGGGDSSFSDVLIVRVSDEVEPSDWAVVVESEDCVVEHLSQLNSGLLPDFPGLP